MPIPPLTREGAAQAARDELSKHVYQQARPSLLQRVLTAVWRWLLDAYHQLVSVTPGGGLGLVVIVAAIAAAVAVVLRRRGVSWAGRRATGLELPAETTAAQLRAQADALSASQAWADAVRVRLRAVVRALEEQDVLDPRPSRTAAEVAAEAGAALPELRDLLWDAVMAFGEIWYGGRVATRDDDALLRRLDSTVSGRRAGVRAAVSAVPR